MLASTRRSVLPLGGTVPAPLHLLPRPRAAGARCGEAGPGRPRVRSPGSGRTSGRGRAGARGAAGSGLAGTARHGTARHGTARHGGAVGARGAGAGERGREGLKVRGWRTPGPGTRTRRTPGAVRSRAPHGLSWTESWGSSEPCPSRGCGETGSAPLGGTAEPRPLVSLFSAGRGRQGMCPPVSSPRTGGPAPGGCAEPGHRGLRGPRRGGSRGPSGPPGRGFGSGGSELGAGAPPCPSPGVTLLLFSRPVSAQRGAQGLQLAPLLPHSRAIGTSRSLGLGVGTDPVPTGPRRAVPCRATLRHAMSGCGCV